MLDSDSSSRVRSVLNSFKFYNCKTQYMLTEPRAPSEICRNFLHEGHLIHVLSGPSACVFLFLLLQLLKTFGHMQSRSSDESTWNNCILIVNCCCLLVPDLYHSV